jgi:hypothetical protein
MKPHRGDESETKAVSETPYDITEGSSPIRVMGIQENIRSGS